MELYTFPMLAFASKSWFRLPFCLECLPLPFFIPPWLTGPLQDSVMLAPPPGSRVQAASYAHNTLPYWILMTSTIY